MLNKDRNHEAIISAQDSASAQKLKKTARHQKPTRKKNLKEGAYVAAKSTWRIHAQCLSMRKILQLHLVDEICIVLCTPLHPHQPSHESQTPKLPGRICDVSSSGTIDVNHGKAKSHNHTTHWKAKMVVQSWVQWFQSYVWCFFFCCSLHLPQCFTSLSPWSPIFVCTLWVLTYCRGPAHWPSNRDKRVLSPHVLANPGKIKLKVIEAIRSC